VNQIRRLGYLRPPLTTKSTSRLPHRSTGGELPARLAPDDHWADVLVSAHLLSGVPRLNRGGKSKPRSTAEVYLGVMDESLNHLRQEAHRALGGLSVSSIQKTGSGSRPSPANTRTRLAAPTPT
jgi:hypothetical protein